MEGQDAEYLTRAVLARRLGVDCTTVDRRRLPRVKVGQTVRYDWGEVRRYLAAKGGGQAAPEKEPCAVCRLYGQSAKLAEGLRFGSVVTEVFYHDGKVSKVTRQRRENYLERGGE